MSENFWVVVTYNRVKQGGQWISNAYSVVGQDDFPNHALLEEVRKAFRDQSSDMFEVTRPMPGAQILDNSQGQAVAQGDFQDVNGLIWKFPVVTLPVPTPAPEPQPDFSTLPVPPSGSGSTTMPQLYELRIRCPANPEIPGYLVDKMRAALSVGGYDLASVAQTSEGYTIQVSKHGSITLTAAAVIVIGVLALLAVGVIAYAWVRLSDNNTVETNSNNATDAISKLTDLRNSGQIDESTFQELTQAVLAAYQPGETPGSSDSGSFWGIDGKTAIIAAIAFLALSRR